MEREEGGRLDLRRATGLARAASARGKGAREARTAAAEGRHRRHQSTHAQHPRPAAAPSTAPPPHLDLDVRGLALGAAERLVDHDARVGQRVALALLPRREQEGAHGRRQPHADGGDVGAHVAHRVKHGHACGGGGRGCASGPRGSADGGQRQEASGRGRGSSSWRPPSQAACCDPSALPRSAAMRPRARPQPPPAPLPARGAGPSSCLSPHHHSQPAHAPLSPSSPPVLPPAFPRLPHHTHPR